MAGSMRIAAIGDVHGCIVELEQLYRAVEHCSLDEIWIVGDLVDRGPANDEVIDFCIEKGIKAVRGNHDDSILQHYERLRAGGTPPRNADKRKTLAQLNEAHAAYLESLPFLHVIDPLNLVLVHAGLWPDLPLYAQPHNVIRCNMVHPEQPGKTRWFGDDAIIQGVSEEQSRAEGWERWYRVYDHEQTAIYGHTVWNQPFVHQNEGAGMTIGVDTGVCFGGSLTACVFDNINSPYFVSIKSRRVWYPETRRSCWEK